MPTSFRFDTVDTSSLKSFFQTHSTEDQASLRIAYGNLVVLMEKLTLEELKEFYQEEPVWPGTEDLFYRCKVAARCRYFLVKKTGGSGFDGSQWWEKPEYVMPTMVYPLEGKYPELNEQYLLGGDFSFKSHNILYLKSDLRRV